MKVTQILLGAARRPLSAKQGNKNYYKGNRSGRIGSFTSNGNFIVEQHKKREYIMPVYTDLQCYVSTSVKESRNDFSVRDYFRNGNEFGKLEAKKCYKDMFTRGVLKYSK